MCNVINHFNIGNDIKLCFWITTSKITVQYNYKCYQNLLSSSVDSDFYAMIHFVDNWDNYVNVLVTN